MHPFRKLINESFFNPLLHFIPLLLFLITKDVFGNSTALVIVYFTVVAVLVYSYLLYANLYKYLGISYLISAAIISFIIFAPDLVPTSLKSNVLPEYIAMLSLILILILQKKIVRFVHEKTPKELAMTNNLNEHFRIVWLLTSIFFIYIHSTIISQWYFPDNESVTSFIHDTYIASMFFIIAYEFIRVTLIRVSLFKEEWWPIVNEKGHVTGSVQSQISLNSSEKYMHPVIRVLYIKDSLVLLKCDPESGIWDTFISEHIRMNESIDMCLQRTCPGSENNPETSSSFITKYIQESEKEIQYIYFFVECKPHESLIARTDNSNLKWWTYSQIKENFDCCIFSENFKTEINILQRLGMFDNKTFTCNCILKETVLNSVTKNTE